MAKIPTLARLTSEEFKDQASWIGRLIAPLNQYFEFINQALTKNLTITDNMAGAIKTVEVSGTYPVKVAWDLSSRPVGVWVAGITKSNGASYSITDAVQVRWSYNQAGQLQIDGVAGTLSPAISSTDKYKLTLVCITG